MPPKNENEEDNRPGFVKWIVGSGILVVFALISGGITVYKFVSGIQADREQEVADRALFNEQFREVSEHARRGAEFAACWPLSNCEGIQALPVDGNQNKRLDALEAATARLHQFNKELCQGIRDRETEKDWPDCSQL